MGEQVRIEHEIVRDILAREMPEYELVETAELSPERRRDRSEHPRDDHPRQFAKSPAIGVLHAHYGALFGSGIEVSADGLEGVLAACRQGDLAATDLRLVTVRPQGGTDRQPVSVIVSLEERLVVGLQT
jgi:hypothetical protein